MPRHKLTVDESIKGGKAKTEKKSTTARENGKKGGRPRKDARLGA